MHGPGCRTEVNVLDPGSEEVVQLATQGGERATGQGGGARECQLYPEVLETTGTETCCRGSGG